MNKQRVTQSVLIVALVAAVFCMGIGFALQAYTQALTITSTTTVKASKWDIHFDETTFTEDTAHATDTSHSISGTTVTYAATLAKQGDYYTFQINAVNAGTLDATLKNVTINVPSTIEKFVKVTVSVDGSTYEETSGAAVALAHSTSNVVIVKVEYTQPDDYNDLNTEEDIQADITVSLDYQQDL